MHGKFQIIIRNVMVHTKQDTSINIYSTCATISSTLMVYLSKDNNGVKSHEDCKSPTAVATTYIIILQSVQLCRFEH